VSGDPITLRYKGLDVFSDGWWGGCGCGFRGRYVGSAFRGGLQQAEDGLSVRFGKLLRLGLIITR